LELHRVYWLSDLIRAAKTRIIEWAVYVARMRKFSLGEKIKE
jgi:hypothetical protein